MVLTKDDLIASINSIVRANGVAAINGPAMNGVLNNMTNTLYGSYFLYPHKSLTDSDVGKIVMPDGSGNATVYQLSSAQAQQTGTFVLNVKDQNSFGPSSSLEISNKNGKFVVTQNMLLQIAPQSSPPPTGGGSGSGVIMMPIQSVDDLFYRLISAFNSMGLTGYTFTNQSAVNNLTIQEQVYQCTYIKANSIDSGNNNPSINVVQDSLPALAPAPTVYPLGKLIGIDGNQAMISSTAVESYELAGPLTMVNSLFDYQQDIPFSQSSGESVLTNIIMPWANGQAMPFDLTKFDLDSSTIKELRHQFIGIAIGVSGTTVTVYNIPYVSIVLSVVLRLAKGGIINLGNL